MKLFVAGLPFDMDDQELNNIFAEYGEVTSAKIITDRETRKSRGFGFVELADEPAQAAMKALNGASLEGRTITVKEAEDRPKGGSSGGGGSRGGFRPRDNNRW